MKIGPANAYQIPTPKIAERYVTLVLFILIFLFVVVLAFKRPLLTILIYVVIAIIPYIFYMVPQYEDDAWAIPIGFGFRASDLVVIAMFCATVLELIRQREQTKPSVKLGLRKVLLFVGLFLVFEILRNVSEYGIAAFGEFRYTYIGLVVPVYTSVFFHSTNVRYSLFKWLMGFSLFLTLVSLPLIGLLKGWSFGSESRFLPADVSLGLFYGYLSLVLGSRFGLFKICSTLILALGVLVFFLIVVDGHRSVWMSILFIVIALVIFEGLNWDRIRRLLVPVLLVAVTAIVLANRFIDIGDFLSQRSLAYSTPEEDQSAGWRLNLWEFQLLRFYNSPFVGEGFGRYWGLSEGKGDIGVMPHNLYVMILAKLGLIGLILYVFAMFKLFRILHSWSKAKRRLAGPEYAIGLVSIACLVGANVFAIAYPVDPGYSWLFVGLGLASVKGTAPLVGSDAFKANSEQSQHV